MPADSMTHTDLLETGSRFHYSDLLDMDFDTGLEPLTGGYVHPRDSACGLWDSVCALFCTRPKPVGEKIK
jgi:hypothetical protein